jgi:hypothetical protein
MRPEFTLRPRHGSKEAPIQRFWRQVEITDGCWIWTGYRNASGYGRMRIHGIGRAMIFAHHISYEIHHGPVPDGGWVLHHCDNPPCIRPDHIYLGTPKQNSQDAVTRGRRPDVRGENNGFSKLTEAGVREIRRRAEAGEKVGSIAKDLGMSYPGVRDIIIRRNWPHVV